MGNVICEYSFTKQLDNGIIHGYGINIRCGKSSSSTMKWNLTLKTSDGVFHCHSIEIDYINDDQTVLAVKTYLIPKMIDVPKKFLTMILESIIEANIIVVSKNEIIYHPYPTALIYYANEHIKALKKVADGKV